MLFAVLVAALVAILAGSLAFLVQAFLASRPRVAGEEEALRGLLLSRGSLTPSEAAEGLLISVEEADRRLRGLVDDERVRLQVDLLAGALRFSAMGPAPAAAPSPLPAGRKAMLPSRAESS